MARGTILAAAGVRRGPRWQDNVLIALASGGLRSAGGPEHDRARSAHGPKRPLEMPVLRKHYRVRDELGDPLATGMSGMTPVEDAFCCRGLPKEASARASAQEHGRAPNTATCVGFAQRTATRPPHDRLGRLAAAAVRQPSQEARTYGNHFRSSQPLELRV